MESLPRELLQFIQPYLTFLDYYYLLNTSKLLFHGIKYETCRYKLCSSKSWDYLNSPTFREDLLRRNVKNPRVQLQLNLLGLSFNLSSLAIYFQHLESVEKVLCSFPLTEDNSPSYLPPISSIEWSHPDQSFLSYVHLDGNPFIKCLSLSFFPALQSLVGFENLEELHLFDCPSLANLDYFAYLPLKRVKLSYCHLVSCVKGLSTVKSVLLRNCQGLVDVSPLQDNNDVHIIECRNVQSFSQCFQRSHSVQLNYKTHKIEVDDLSNSFPLARRLLICCSKTLRTLSANPPLPAKSHPLRSLSLTLCPLLQDIASLHCFPFLSYVSINGCYLVSDLSPLQNIRIVDLAHLRITSLQGLGRNHSAVSVRYCPFLDDFSPLNGLLKVKIVSCKNFSHAEDLSDVHHLVIDSCIRFINPAPLHSVARLDFINCDALCSLEGLYLVSEISLKGCKQITTMEGFISSCICPGKRNEKISLSHTSISNHHLLSLSGLYSWDVRGDWIVYLRIT